MEGNGMVPVVPSCTIKRENKGETWQKLLDAGGSPHKAMHVKQQNGAAATRRSPCNPKPAAGARMSPKGVVGVSTVSEDDDSPEAKIQRLEKRLRRNLAPAQRSEMEEELEVLKGFVKAMRREEERASADLGGVAGAVGVKKGARRRVGAEAPLEEEIGEVFDDDDDDDDDDDVYDDDGDDDEEGLRQEAAARAARINIAAPKMTHPQTMARMQDWKGELERRIKEQQMMDGAKGYEFNRFNRKEPEQQQPWPAVCGLPFLAEGDAESPIGKIHLAVEGLVEGFGEVFGFKSKAEEAVPEPPRALPPQTFSRRL